MRIIQPCNPACAPIAGAKTGLGGISDDGRLLCFALALWNGKDLILKERMLDLTNSEANHVGNIKELSYGGSRVYRRWIPRKGETYEKGFADSDPIECIGSFIGIPE
jgi:hypothetical protein